MMLARENKWEGDVINKEEILKKAITELNEYTQRVTSSRRLKGEPRMKPRRPRKELRLLLMKPRRQRSSLMSWPSSLSRA